MKKLTVLIFLAGSLSFGQNFFETEDAEPDQQSNPHSAFQSQTEYDEPDQGAGSIGNPGDEVPIDKWILLLPIAGITIGFYFLKKKKSNLI